LAATALAITPPKASEKKKSGLGKVEKTESHSSGH
jgi:hypothetical protein